MPLSPWSQPIRGLKDRRKPPILKHTLPFLQCYPEPADLLLEWPRRSPSLVYTLSPALVCLLARDMGDTSQGHRTADGSEQEAYGCTNLALPGEHWYSLGWQEVSR
jgi:hypothetical protein